MAIATMSLGTSRLVRLVLLGFLWVTLLGGLVFWFGARDRTVLTVAAGPASGESFELVTAIARALEANNPKLDIDVYETQGSGENLRLVESGQVDLAAIQADYAATGNERAIATLFADAYQLVVTTQSGIDSIADLVGQRVAIPPEGSGQNSSFWFLLEHFGIDAAALTALPMSDEAANFAMQHGQVDAVFRVRVPGNVLVRDLVRDQRNVRLVPVDQSAALALRKPTLRSGSIPRGSYRGHPALPVADTPTALVDRILIARSDLDEDAVYELTRSLFEQRAALTGLSRLAGFVRPLDDADQVAIPLHEGARRYYDREKPSLVQENSRLLATLLYIGALFTSLLLALRSRVQRAHRVRVSDYNGELMAIAEQARASGSAAELQALQNTLLDILQEVVSDLDADRVTKEEFDHFSFTWQAVDQVIRDRAASEGSTT